MCRPQKADLSLLTPADLARVEMEPNRRLRMNLEDRARLDCSNAVLSLPGRPLWQCSLDTIPSLSIEGSRITPVPVKEVGSRSPGRALNAPPSRNCSVQALQRWQGQRIPGSRSAPRTRLDATPAPSQPFPRDAGRLRREDLTL